MNRTTAKDDFADSAPRAVPTGPAPGGFRRRDFLKAAAVASMTVTCGLDAAAQVALHFLQGAPLYYTSLARWTSAAHLQPDSSVHF